MAGRNGDAGRRDIHPRDRPCRFRRADGRRACAPDPRRAGNRAAEVALSTGARAAVGAQGAGRPRGGCDGERLRPAHAADRAGAAGRLRFFLPELFRGDRRQRFLSHRSQAASGCGRAVEGPPCRRRGERARGDRRAHPPQHRRCRGRDSGGADRGRARRDTGRDQRSDAAHRHLPHHLDFRPAHGAGCGHDHGHAARRPGAAAGFFLPPSGQEICRLRRALRDGFLSADFRNGGGCRAQLHHAGRDAARGAVRPFGADHAQPGHLRRPRHPGFAARGGGAELPDVVCCDRRARRRLRRLVGSARIAAGRRGAAANVAGRHRRPQGRRRYRRPGRHLAGGGICDHLLCGVAFSARGAAQPVREPRRDADRLDPGHALRGSERAGHALRRRLAVPLCDG